MPTLTNRAVGVLMPVSSLPGPYGIGCFGREAYRFVDFLAQAGQTVWQVLPLGPTGYGDSPYQSCSAFAGNPYFIDLDRLVNEGLLTHDLIGRTDFGADPGRVDYAALYRGRFALLRAAYAVWKRQRPVPGCETPYSDEYYRFVFLNDSWLEDYCLYMAAKEENHMAHWLEWPKPLRTRQPEALAALKERAADELGFWAFVQFQFSRQWQALKAYANQRGVKIFGDIPIYVSADSADAWAGGSLFEVDGEGRPRRVAGCPPDYFSADGQLWGNPLYDWNAQAKTGYAWWIGRVRHALGLYDLLRIDHFRAFDTYWAIPADATTAREGKWEQGPGMALFRALEDALGELPIVAENLGLLFDSVRRLLADSGLPGMKVLQFAFDPGCDSEYLPHNHIPNCVVYPGTHDNTTLKDWLATANPGELAKAKAMLGLNKEEGYVRGVIRAALGSVARLTVIPMADWLELGPEARINAPGTGTGNWQWRAEEGFDTPALARQMRSLCAVFARCSAPEPEQEKQPVQPFTHGAFLALCADQLGRPAAQLTPEADFAELGVDSFDKVGLALAIEDTFGAVISDEDLIDVKTVGQMEYLVEYLLK